MAVNSKLTKDQGAAPQNKAAASGNVSGTEYRDLRKPSKDEMPEINVKRAIIREAKKG